MVAKIPWRLLALSFAIAAGGAPRALSQVAAPAVAGFHTDTLQAIEKQPFNLSPWIIPGSTTVRDLERVLPDSTYRLDFRRGQLWFVGVPPDTFVVSYRTYPFDFRPAYFNRRLTSPEEDTN